MSGSEPLSPASDTVRSAPLRALLLAFAALNLALGVFGAFVPGVPTTVFVLVAGWAAARSSPRLSDWLESHRLFGPMLRNWRAGGYVSRRAKRSASVAMIICAALLFMTASPAWLAAIPTTLMTVVLIWLWSRPEPPQ